MKAKYFGLKNAFNKKYEKVFNTYLFTEISEVLKERNFKVVKLISKYNKTYYAFIIRDMYNVFCFEIEDEYFDKKFINSLILQCYILKDAKLEYFKDMFEAIFSFLYLFESFDFNYKIKYKYTDIMFNL